MLNNKDLNVFMYVCISAHNFLSWTNNITIFLLRWILNDEVLKTIIFSNFMRKLALVHAACHYLCYIIHQRQWLKRRRVLHIPTKSTIERQNVRDELMSRLRNSEKCYDVIRMGPQAFQHLHDILQRDGDL